MSYYPADRAAWTTLTAVLTAALAVVAFVRPAASAPTAPFGALTKANLSADASLNAFGESRAVRLRFSLPGHEVEFPLEVGGDLSQLSYAWIGAQDSTAAGVLRPITGADFVAPTTPGFYRLAIIRGAEREIIPEPALAVMVPFEEKVGATLNGYHIGTYLAERLSRSADHPVGFLEVQAADTGIRVSTHLRLGDFVTHDSQRSVWPKYVALSPLLLDKLELVLTQVDAHAGISDSTSRRPDVAFDVHSGYRTPAHNRLVWRAVGDSRHEYGDAADVSIDADGDGRVTLKDEVLVALAVDAVERAHPDLVGGLGLYTSHHYRTPYVHIDVRGTRSRWTG